MKTSGRQTDSEPKSMKMLAVVAIALVFALVLTESVSAVPIVDAFKNMGGNVGSYFNDYASKTEPSFLDFFIFSVIFFAMCWIGFSAVFKEAKGACVALSVSVGFALSIALVYGGKFTIKKLFPFASILLFLLLMIGIYSLLKKFVFTKDTIAAKMLSFVFAIIISLLLLALLWNFICSGSNCENNAFMKKIFGSESVIGKLFGGLTGELSGGPIPAPSGGVKMPQSAIEKCGNGVKDTGEVCDPKANPTGCAKDTTCWYKCTKCEPSSALGAWGFISDNWGKLLFILLAVIIGGISIAKRKSIAESARKRGAKWKKRRELRAMKKVLEGLSYHERRVMENFRKLCESVQGERKLFENSMLVIDHLTTDIKDTIGGELEFVKSAEVGSSGSISDHIDQLATFNKTENLLITGADGILHNINQELSKILSIDKEMKDALDTLENIDEHFKEHAEIMETFKQHNFREKEIIKKMNIRLGENKKKFEEIDAACNTMIAGLEDMHNTLHNLEADKKHSYEEIVTRVKSLKDKFVKVRGLLSQKIQVLHYLVDKMKEMEADVKALHRQECEKVLKFLEEAKGYMSSHSYDNAMYFCSLVIENTDALKKAEMDEESRKNLESASSEALAMIKSCLPNVFASMREKIQEEIKNGVDGTDKNAFDKLLKLISVIGRSHLRGTRYEKEILSEVVQYENKMNILTKLVNTLKEGKAAKDELYRALGLTPL